MTVRERPSDCASFRSFAAKAGVAALACAAAWNFVVRPLDTEVRLGNAALAKAGAEVAALEASASGLSELDTFERTIRAERERMYRGVALAAESSRIYATLRAEASKAGVTIQSIEPVPSRQVSKGIGQQSLEPRAETFGYSLEVTGRYDAIAGFIDACEHGLGAAKVSKFRVSPTGTTPEGHEPVLRAGVEVMLMKLTPPVNTKPPRSTP